MQPKDELFVTIRNAKGEPICIVERAVAERHGWLEEQGPAEGSEAEVPAVTPEPSESAE